MRKFLLLSSAVALLLTGVLGGAANAAPAPTCGAASAAVTSAESDVRSETRDVSNAKDRLDDAKAETTRTTNTLQGLKLLPLDDPLRLGLPGAQLAFDQATANQAARQTELDAEKAQLAAAQARLADAIDVRDDICAVVAPTTTTPPPIVQTQVAPTPTVAPQTVGDDVINDGSIRQTVNVNVPEDNDSSDGVLYRPRTSGGIATG